MSKKKNKIKKLAADMLKESYKKALEKVEAALNSGVIDIEVWDEKSSPMIVPKTIVTAVLVSESKQYEGKGTFFEKEVSKNVKKLQLYI